MNINDEIANEYKKIENEKIINTITLENSKNKFAEEILRTNLGNELKNCNMFNINGCYKKKLPLKLRVKRLIENLKIVFGYGVE